MMGASKVENKSLNLSSGVCKTDKTAFSKVHPDGVSVIANKEFDENVVGKDSNQASSKQPFESLDVSQNSFSMQGMCVESNIVIILTIIFAITIKLLELFEGIVTSINDVLNQPSRFRNKSECFYSGATSPVSLVSSVGKECPEYFCGELRQEKPQNFKCVVPKEGKLTFEKVDVIVFDPLDVGDVTVKDVLINKISDNDVYSSGNAVNIKTGSFGPSEVNDLSILGSETKMLTRSEVGSPVGALLINSPSVGDKLKLHTAFNGICVPFVAENPTLPISIAGHNFYCLIDSGAAVTAVSAKVWRECFSHACLSLDKCSSECVISVNGCQLTTIGKLLVEFVDFHAFPFEAHVIEDLTCDVILGRDFLQKICFTVDFENGTLFFPRV